MNTTATETIISIRQVAEFMGVHERTVYRLANSGKIPGFKLGGKWLFDRALIRQWLGRQMLRNCAQT